MQIAQCLKAVGAFRDVSQAMAMLDEIERRLCEYPSADELRLAPGESAYARISCEPEHSFTPGLYRRIFRAPAGSFCVSKIHGTTHPFVVTKGVIVVCGMGAGRVSVEQTIKAPYHGITEPLTRRFLFFKEDTEWTTYHPTDKKTVEEVEADIIIPRNKLEMNQQFAMEGGALSRGLR